MTTVDFETIPTFNVLDRDLNLQQSYLIEASAGTGKTFSIENIVVRLILEHDIPIEKILIVTFTRAATKDLKVRIHKTLTNVLQILKNPQESIPDYIKAFLELGNEHLKKGIQRLKKSLSLFDQAQIFTIHGFCSRMLNQFLLESDFNAYSKDKLLTKNELNRLVRDFFRVDIKLNLYSPTQLQIILNNHSNNIDELQEKLIQLITSEKEFVKLDSFEELFVKFKEVLASLKQTYSFNSALLKEDLEKQIPFLKVDYKFDLDRTLKLFLLFDQNTWSEEDFDLAIQDQFYFCQYLRDENWNQSKLKKSSKPTLHHPELINLLEKHLVPLLVEAGSYEYLLVRMASDCKKLIENYQDKEEKQREGDLLKKIYKALNNSDFINQTKKLYKTVIIDEFQDTDPLQWEIFEKLFCNSSTNLFLVGDPKQSIYAFRQADIYTYLSAAKAITHHVSLDTNYRSQPTLIEGLNILFSSCQNLFPLPQLKSNLPYPLVKFAKEKRCFNDELAAVHFFSATFDLKKPSAHFPSKEIEEEYYFPYIAQEILRLHENDNYSFKQFAILIKDRYQGQRLGTYLEKLSIPFTLQRQVSLTETSAWLAIKELLEAIISPKDESLLKIALGGELIAWTFTDILLLNNMDVYEKVLAQIFKLKKILFENGFAKFYQAFLLSHWHDDQKTVLEKILSREKGDFLYEDLNQISSLLMHEDEKIAATPESLITFLIESKKVSLEDDSRLKKISDPTREAVAILTVHNSKGLEFEIVFALGLLSRTQELDFLVPVRKKLSQEITPCLNKENPLYKSYAEEIDAEKMRQLYVAFTRAKHRLYIPHAVQLSTIDSLKTGSASPLEIFLSKLNQGSNEPSIDKLKFLLQKNPSLFSISEILEKNDNVPFSSLKQPKEILKRPLEVQLLKKTSYIQSFTSLSRNHTSSAETSILKTPKDFYNLEKTSHTLPAGNLTGTLLHELLETISLIELESSQAMPELISQVQNKTKNTPFFEWSDVLAKIVHQALTISINGLSLNKIDPDLSFKETEFLYPCHSHLKVPELEWTEGFLKGVIDLVFFSEDRYYIIDWKSNWLGPSNTYYSQQAMHEAMLQHHYYAQAYIYKEALRKYLKIFDKRPFDDIFGGCYYIFLRGLNNQSGITSEGIIRL